MAPAQLHSSRQWQQMTPSPCRAHEKFVIMRAALWLALAGLLAIACCQAAAAPSDLEASLDFLKARGEDSYNHELIELVSIPSVSSLPENKDDILAAAAWLERRLKAAGLENVAIMPTEGPRPAVYADYLHAPGAPTALIYGHYDVQPAADTAHLWDSPPFKPEIRDGRMYGRGADDDKGSLLPPIQALEAILQGSPSRRLPINIKLILEGEEEIGSPFLHPFLKAHAGKLACDFVLSADGGQIGEEQPGMTLGLRGAAAVEVEVVTATTDAHSGVFGGAVQNPARALSQLLATMWHPGNGSVAVAGFYDQVRPITDTDRDDMTAYNFDEARDLLGPLGASESYGEAGFTPMERLWHRPTLEVVGIGGGFQGEGIKTIIPGRAFAKLAARLVPDQTPGEIAALIEAHVAAHHPPACNVTVRPLGFSARPYTQPKESMPNRAAAKVLTALMGAPPKFVRSGATIPALAAFQEYLNASTTVFAFGLPDSNLHAPNENFRLAMYRLGREAWVRLLFELGEQAAGGAGAAAAVGAAGQQQEAADRSEL